MFADANPDMHVHTCTDVHATMHTNTLTPASICACKQVGVHAAIANKKTHRCYRCLSKLFLLHPLFGPSTPPFQNVQGADSAGPTPPSVGVSYFCHTFSSPGHCHVPGPTEHRGFKQERQHLSVRLVRPRHHMPSPAHVTTCLEVHVEVH